MMLSMRSPTHFTGRPVLRAAHTTSTSSGKTPPFIPKPPPTSGDTTRKFSSRSRNTLPASVARMRCGTCVLVWSVVRLARRVMLGKCSARLHGVRRQPVVDDLERHDMRGLGEGRIGRGLVAALERKPDIVGRALPDQRCVGL